MRVFRANFGYWMIRKSKKEKSEWRIKKSLKIVKKKSEDI